MHPEEHRNQTLLPRQSIELCKRNTTSHDQLQETPWEDEKAWKRIEPEAVAMAGRQKRRASLLELKRTERINLDINGGLMTTRIEGDDTAVMGKLRKERDLKTKEKADLFIYFPSICFWVRCIGTF